MDRGTAFTLFSVLRTPLPLARVSRRPTVGAHDRFAITPLLSLLNVDFEECRARHAVPERRAVRAVY